MDRAIPGLEKFTKPSRFADERRPPMDQVIDAVRHPEEASPAVAAYLQLNPELVDEVRRLLGEQSW